MQAGKYLFNVGAARLASSSLHTAAARIRRLAASL